MALTNNSGQVQFSVTTPGDYFVFVTHAEGYDFATAQQTLTNIVSGETRTVSFGLAPMIPATPQSATALAILPALLELGFTRMAINERVHVIEVARDQPVGSESYAYETLAWPRRILTGPYQDTAADAQFGGHSYRVRVKAQNQTGDSSGYAVSNVATTPFPGVGGGVLQTAGFLPGPALSPGRFQGLARRG